MKKPIRSIFSGFLVWLIPFTASILFYTREGGLRIDVFLFKTIMIVIGSSSAAFLVVSYFKKITADFLKEGVVVGITWFGINILLDLVVLIPISGMPVSDYFKGIGLRYLLMPVICIMVGRALENKK